MAQHSAVGVENLALGDETDIAAVIDYRQIPCTCIVERFHDFLHGVAQFDFRRRRAHELVYVHALV